MAITPSTPENDRAAAIAKMREWFDDPSLTVGPGRCPICTARIPSHQPGCPTVPAAAEMLIEARYRVALFADEMDDWLRRFGDDVAEELWDAVIRFATPRRADAARRSRQLRHYMGLLVEATS